MASQLPVESSSQSITIEVITEIANHEGVDPRELEPPLHSGIDREAVDRLFTPTKDGPRNGRVVFEYNGYAVQVSEDGTVSAEPTERTNGGGVQ